MSKRDFDNEITRIANNIKTWHTRLQDLVDKSMTEMIDLNYRQALESAIRRETHRLECFLYVKRLLDKPVRKKKWKKYEATCRLPKQFPETESSSSGNNITITDGEAEDV